MWLGGRGVVWRVTTVGAQSMARLVSTGFFVLGRRGGGAGYLHFPWKEGRKPVSKHAPGWSGLKTSKIGDWHIWGIKQVWMLVTGGLITLCTYCLTEILKQRVKVKQESHVLFQCNKGLTTIVTMEKVHFILGKLIYPVCSHPMII